MPKKDLTKMAKDIEQVIMEYNNLKERPAVVIAFTCEPTFDEVHWISNVDRPAAVMILRETASKLVTNSN